MFLYNTLAQNVNDNIFVMAQSGSKVHRRFRSKCHQRHGGNDEDKNNSNKKKYKARKKNPSVNEAWQNDKNDCNRHRCKGSCYWLVALSWSLRISPAGLAANRHAPGETRTSQALKLPLLELICRAVGELGMLTVQAGGELGSLRLSAASRAFRLRG